MLVEEVKYNYRKGRTVQTIRTPRLVAGKFMLRTQMWIFLPKKSNSGKMELGWTLCPHIRALEDTRTRTFGILGKDLRCRAQHFESPGEAKGCSNCGEVKQCQLCQTEYQLNGMHFGKLGVAVVVSSWRNFGEIRTPFDPIWLAHHQVVPNEIVDFSPGSIKETFEGGKNYRFDAGRGKHLNKALTARYSEEKFEDGF
ncbi:hypothetical protein BJ875DRAFT_450507 [Amylocarpus encephaloides]|uniref:Uncharacterized protein n=1 Tax=Amylocarpus encephaloides TaxID=45428 RepID=A0A9P7YT96_9HELO|nr:hypothetical protein BJ875DRAFT_450507 [Amylocarpus encephaloides]